MRKIIFVVFLISTISSFYSYSQEASNVSIITTKKEIKKIKINKKSFQKISFSGPNEDITYIITISKNNEVPILQEEFIPNSNSKNHDFPFKIPMKKNKEIGKKNPYELSISYNYGEIKGIKRSSLILIRKNKGFYGFFVLLAGLLFIGDDGGLKIPLLPEPPNPNG